MEGKLVGSHIRRPGAGVSWGILRREQGFFFWSGGTAPWAGDRTAGWQDQGLEKWILTLA